MYKDDLRAFAKLAGSMATILDTWADEDSLAKSSFAQHEIERIASQAQELNELLDTVQEKDIGFAPMLHSDVKRLMQDLNYTLEVKIRGLKRSQELTPWNTVLVDPEYIAITSNLTTRQAKTAERHIICQDILSLNVLRRMSLEDWLKVRNCGEQTANILFNAFHQD